MLVRREAKSATTTIPACVSQPRSSREGLDWDTSHVLAFKMEGRGLGCWGDGSAAQVLVQKHENLNLDLWHPHKTQRCHRMPIILAQGRQRLEHAGITHANTHVSMHRQTHTHTTHTHMLCVHTHPDTHASTHPCMHRQNL